MRKIGGFHRLLVGSGALILTAFDHAQPNREALSFCDGCAASSVLALGQPEATFRGQLSSSGKRASTIVHPICVAWRVPIAIFSGSRWRRASC